MSDAVLDFELRNEEVRGMSMIEAGLVVKSAEDL